MVNTKTSRPQPGLPAAVLIDKSGRLLRRTPAGVLCLYFAAAVPFAAGLVFFWAAMSRGNHSIWFAAAAALVVSVLFAWMKIGQNLYCCRLSQHLTGRRETFDIFRSACVQTAIHPTGILTLPICLAIALPYGWACAFYQHATALSSRADDRKLLRELRQQTVQWPLQNHAVTWLMSPALTVVGVSAVMIMPPLMRLINPATPVALQMATSMLFIVIAVLGSPVGMLMGANFAIILLLLSQAGSGSPLASVLLRDGAPSSTFAVIVCCLVYLCLDPVVKSCYVLRSHHSRSDVTGEDLHARLRQISDVG
ncbi:MAG: hypothetical protein QGF67_05790 [Lentisphaeria bacterium]|jgi:hypothetical protein|nr:hypothetical protein [Lentisphaeria bacterium]